ncbi:serine-rich adhesin for platelets-like isoform X2 [Ptychodera flava]|uniref:serine-rich adhesin for platelets-like isoform X2 n=1 Tax=Ptychodera flava TaxID=63121 RepID=UPI003969C744
MSEVAKEMVRRIRVVIQPLEELKEILTSWEGKDQIWYDAIEHDDIFHHFNDSVFGLQVLCLATSSALDSEFPASIFDSLLKRIVALKLADLRDGLVSGLRSPGQLARGRLTLRIAQTLAGFCDDFQEVLRRTECLINTKAALHNSSEEIEFDRCLSCDVMLSSVSDLDKYKNGAGRNRQNGQQLHRDINCLRQTVKFLMGDKIRKKVNARKEENQQSSEADSENLQDIPRTLQTLFRSAMNCILIIVDAETAGALKSYLNAPSETVSNRLQKQLVDKHTTDKELPCISCIQTGTSIPDNSGKEFSNVDINGQILSHRPTSWTSSAPSLPGKEDAPSSVISGARSPLASPGPRLSDAWDDEFCSQVEVHSDDSYSLILAALDSFNITSSDPSLDGQQSTRHDTASLSDLSNDIVSPDLLSPDRFRESLCGTMPSMHIDLIGTNTSDENLFSGYSSVAGDDALERSPDKSSSSLYPSTSPSLPNQEYISSEESTSSMRGTDSGITPPSSTSPDETARVTPEESNSANMLTDFSEQSASGPELASETQDTARSSEEKEESSSSASVPKTESEEEETWPSPKGQAKLFLRAGPSGRRPTSCESGSSAFTCSSLEDTSSSENISRMPPFSDENFKKLLMNMESLSSGKEDSALDGIEERPSFGEDSISIVSSLTAISGTVSSISLPSSWNGDFSDYDSVSVASDMVAPRKGSSDVTLLGDDRQCDGSPDFMETPHQSRPNGVTQTDSGNRSIAYGDTAPAIDYSRPTSRATVSRSRGQALTHDMANNLRDREEKMKNYSVIDSRKESRQSTRFLTDKREIKRYEGKIKEDTSLEREKNMIKQSVGDKAEIDIKYDDRKFGPTPEVNRRVIVAANARLSPVTERKLATYPPKVPQRYVNQTVIPSLGRTEQHMYREPTGVATASVRSDAGMKSDMLEREASDVDVTTALGPVSTATKRKKRVFSFKKLRNAFHKSSKHSVKDAQTKGTASNYAF